MDDFKHAWDQVSQENVSPQATPSPKRRDMSPTMTSPVYSGIASPFASAQQRGRSQERTETKPRSKLQQSRTAAPQTGFNHFSPPKYNKFEDEKFFQTPTQPVRSNREARAPIRARSNHFERDLADRSVTPPPLARMRQRAQQAYRSSSKRR